MDQRRLLLALAVSLLLLMVYQEVANRLAPTPPARPKSPPLQTATTPETLPPPPAPPSALAVPVDGSTSISVETEVLHAEITPTGARLASLDLKQYRRAVSTESGPLNLVAVTPVLPGTLELAPGTSDAALAYRCDPERLVLRWGEQGVVTCTGETEGSTIVKRYRFSGNGYLFDLQAEVPRDRPVGLVLAAMPSPGNSHRGSPEVAVALANQKLVQKSLDDVAKQAVSLPEAEWAGFAAQYFLVAGVATPAAGRVIFTLASGVPVVRLDATAVEGEADFAIYAGPKDRDDLARAGHGLDRALDFGRFWFIAVPLLHALQLLHRVTGNFGVAIILLTAVIKLATIPLTQVTLRNMREMQRLQPEMTKLRERFKDDQLALQREMMDLYKRHHVNPLSGCLPMLLQLPIFVGLYNALNQAIELRHARFALWINDLSAPDRLVIAGLGVPVLTLLMGASMFVQQWLTPQQGDPAQQRMMMFMPLIFTFMFINFPVGLVLYWLVNNVLSIAQQYWIMREAAPRPARSKS